MENKETAKNKNYRIVKLVCENFKRLELVELDIDGNVIVVKGENGEGKSSVLDAIWIALTGKNVPDDPISTGKDRSNVSVDITDGDIRYTVRKTFKQSGHSLVVETDNQRVKSPQAFLDKILGNISFDPFEFIRLRPLEQKRALQNFLGIDFTEIDNSKKALNESVRDIVSKKQLLETQGKSEKEKLQKLTDQLQEILKSNNLTGKESINNLNAQINEYYEAKKIVDDGEGKIAQLRVDYTGMQADVESNNTKIKQMEEEIAILKEANEGIEKITLPKIKKDGEKVKLSLAEMTKKIQNTSLVSLQSKQASIIRKDELEKQIKEMKQSVNDKKGLYSSMNTRVEEIKNEIKKLEEQRIAMLKENSFNIEGLEITDDGVTLNGLKLDSNQISKSEIINVGIQLSILLNPGLRILQIKDWNEIDKKNRKVIIDIAVEKGYQLFVEEVTNGKLGFEIIKSNE